MKLKHGELTKIARATGYAVSTICDALHGRVRLPFVVAKHFEEHHGVDRRSWYWPEEFENPFLKKTA